MCKDNFENILSRKTRKIFFVEKNTLVLDRIFEKLYNLSNVNISERIRELATIKVLGFYDKEVYSYVTRETVILTAIGIVLGLISGYFLNYFIIRNL